MHQAHFIRTDGVKCSVNFERPLTELELERIKAEQARRRERRNRRSRRDFLAATSVETFKDMMSEEQKATISGTKDAAMQFLVHKAQEMADVEAHVSFWSWSHAALFYFAS